MVDAVKCAIAIQEAMKSREADSPEAIRIQYRIGINLGDVIVEDDDIFGDGVNVAARLEGICEPGGLCISDIVYQSIENKVDVAFDDRGNQTVKNISRPVHVWQWRKGELSGENWEEPRGWDTEDQDVRFWTSPDGVQIPLMLLERENQLGLMADLLAEVGSLGGKVVLVRGEAGIGKSALVRDFVGGHAVEAHVLFGSCDDLLVPEPMGPFWDISREDISLAEPLEKGDRRAVMMVLLDLLSRSLRSTVLVIEDTHWADEATLDVIKYLGRRDRRNQRSACSHLPRR